MPPWPMALPSSTAMELNSRGTPPASRIAFATTSATSRRCTWPGTNSVKLLATATMGLPKSSRSTPVARMRARAPDMFLPWVTVRERRGGIGRLPSFRADPALIVAPRKCARVSEMETDGPNHEMPYLGVRISPGCVLYVRPPGTGARGREEGRAHPGTAGPGRGAAPGMPRARDHVIAVGPGPGSHVLVCGPQ